jgi:TonB-linked SusC/RagA family outer membrane protein
MKLKYTRNLFIIILQILILNNLVSAQQIKGQHSMKIDSPTLVKKDSLLRIGYDVQPVQNTTSAISTVHGTDLEKNFTLNMGSALYGQMPGLTILQGGSEPGNSAPTIFGRGRNTFGGPGGSDLPLLIIDGSIVGGSGAASSFMQLVPEEVETISFLKDASATAIYGMRAANGVLLVTTKRGAAQPLSVSFSTRQGIQRAAYINRPLNSYDYANLYNEALTNDGLPIKYQPTDLLAYQTNSDPFGHPNVDWYSQVLRPVVPVASYNVTFKGGDKTTQYFVMLNALDNQGLYNNFGDQNAQSINSRYSRYNFRANLDVRLSNRLTVAFNLGGTVQQVSNPYNYDTNTATGTSVGEFNLLASLPPNAFPVYNANGSFGGSATYGSSGINSNPVGNLLNTGFYESNGRTIETSLKFTEQLDFITPGLSTSGSVALNNYYIDGSAKGAGYIVFPSTAGIVATTGFGTVSPLGSNEVVLDSYRNYILQGFLNYKRTFGKSDLAAMAMINSDNVSLPATSGNNSDPYIHNGGGGRLTYVYNSKYIAEYSMGISGSNNFPSGSRYGFFPAGSLGWVVSNEGFLKKNKIVSFLKLRGSYGLTGNDNIPGSRYAFAQTYAQGGTSGTYYLGTANTATAGYAETTLANPNITWEREKVANIGIDATIFKRFDVSVDVYNRGRYNIAVLPNSTLPQYLGIISPYYNQGKSNNKGFEMSVRYNSNTEKPFQYFLQGNLNYSTNKIIFNAEALQLNTNLNTTGYQIGQFFRYRALGFWTQDQINQRAANPSSFAAPVGVPIRAGDIRYADIGGPAGVPDGVIDGNDLVRTPNTNLPKIGAGLSGGFRYRGFDFNAVFEAAGEVTTYLSGAYFTAFQNFGPASQIALGRWTPATASTATYPRLSTLASINNNNNFLSSSFFERDGSFVKLRSAELGYTFPAPLSNKMKLKSARLFVTGTNIFSLDHIPYGDPESLSGYPTLRTITLGAKIQL